jgi:hypothetical protein
MKLTEIIRDKVKGFLHIAEDLDPLRAWRRRFDQPSKEKNDSNSIRQAKVTKAYQSWESNPIADAGLEYKISYILGKGLSYNSESDLVKEKLDEFWKSNNMEIQHIEIVRSVFLEGEVFLHFPKIEMGQSPAIIPFDSNEIKYIARDSVDFRKVEYYHRQYKLYSYPSFESNQSYGALSYTLKDENILAEDMIHFKINSLPNLSRGRGFLHRITEWLDDFTEWLRGRIKINKAKGAFAWVFKLATNNQTDVDAWQTKLNNFSTYDKDGNLIDTIPQGQPLALGKDMSLETPSPQINATNAGEDGRQIKLMSAVGMKLPEFMLSDGANANLATTTSQMSPMIKIMEMEQEMIRLLFVAIFDKVIEMYMGVAGGLPETIEIQKTLPDGSTTVESKSPKELYTLTFPEIATLDIQSLSKPYVDLVNAEIISRQEANAALGYDWEKSKKEIDEEKAKGYKSAQPQPFGQTNPLLGSLTEAINKEQLAEITKLNKDCQAELKANFVLYEWNLKHNVANAKDVFIAKHQDIVKKYLEEGIKDGYVNHIRQRVE